MGAMIAFKTFQALEDFKSCYPRLREVLEYAASIWPDPYMEVTRIWDSRPFAFVVAPKPKGAGESGVHWRIHKGL
jgi:hypothetical protein